MVSRAEDDGPRGVVGADTENSFVGEADPDPDPDPDPRSEAVVPYAHAAEERFCLAARGLGSAIHENPQGLPEKTTTSDERSPTIL